MIQRDEAPIAWAQFTQELDDARNHLATLLGEMNADPDYDEEILRIDLGHISVHLNRA
jgi:hypothetical protein